MSGNRTYIKITILTVLIALALFVFYDANFGKKLISGKLGAASAADAGSEAAYAEDSNTVENTGGLSAGTETAEQTSAENTEISNENIPSGSIKLEADGKSTFVAYGKGFMHFTRDGAKFYNNTSSVKWSDSYTMTSPTVVTGGDYSAVVDILGKTAKVYNASGLAYSIQTEDAITNMGLNKNGHSVVVLNGKSDYRVQAYNASGALKFQRFDEDEGVFPVCADISDNNKVLAVAYIDTSDIEIKSKILFFYTDKEDSKKTETNDMFAACEVSDEIIVNIYNMTGDEYVCVSDKRVFAVNSSGDILWENAAGNRIDRFSFSEEGFVAVAYGDQTVSDSESVEPGTVVILNFGGKRTGAFAAGGKVDFLYCSPYYTVVSAGNNYYGVKANGKTIWEYSSGQGAKSIIPLDNSGQALYVTGSYAGTMNMTH